MTIQADLEHAHTSLTQILNGVRSALVALNDANGAGYPSRASGSQPSTATTPARSDDEAGVVLTRPEQIMEATLEHRPDPAAQDRARLEAAARSARIATTTILDVVTRYQHPMPVRIKPSEAEIPDDWCRSCWRDNQHHSPITLRPTGEPYYEGKCKWCGQFEKAHKRPVPIEILRVRHQGRRVTMQMIDAHKPVKPTKKKGKR